MTWREMLETSYKFFDTVDFSKYLNTIEILSVDEIQELIEEDYDVNHPELLPPEFNGCFFNFVDTEEFAKYLAKRYNMLLTSEIIEKYYLEK